jgi:hypothetical protein
VSSKGFKGAYLDHEEDSRVVVNNVFGRDIVGNYVAYAKM